MFLFVSFVTKPFHKFGIRFDLGCDLGKAMVENMFMN